MQSKESQENEYAMNNVTHDMTWHDHTPFVRMRALSISHMLNLLACMYVQLSIVKNESSILQANCQPANTIAIAKPLPSQAQLSLEQYGIAHPTCSLTGHTSVAKIEGVAFSFGYSQSLESQSGLYSTIRNCLTTHSKPDLPYSL